jgi:phosphatidate cytidylyltransferase
VNGGLVGEQPPAAQARWGDLGRRTLSALVLAPIALLCIWIGAVPFDTMVVLGAFGLSLEWVRMCGFWPGRSPGLAVPPLILLACLAAAIGRDLAGALLLLFGFLALWATSRRGLLAAGLLYLGLPLICLLWLREQPGGRWHVLFLVLVIWASDIGAYAVGRLLRGPKLAPALSPGKTWSGAGGGLLAALLVGLFSPGGTPLLAVLLGIACQAGDLLESGIKRHVGVKDSGQLIPGHGGLLDRLDGLLAAAPVAALAMLAIRGGHW